MTGQDSNQKTIHLGLLGASRIAAHILPSIRKVSGLSVSGVAARRPGESRTFAQTHGIPKSYSSYEECLNDPEIHAVYISTLNADHAEAIRLSLSAGKHVLCEKPLVLSARDAERSFRLAEERDLVLLEGFMYRFHPQIERLKAIVSTGGIGEIKSVRANFSFSFDLTDATRLKRTSAKAGGGALFDVGCYCIDFIHSILEPKKALEGIEIRKRVFPKDPGVDLATTAILSFSDETQATLECAIDAPSLNTWEVSGTKGTVAALRFDPQGKDGAPLYLLNERSKAELNSIQSVDQFEAEFTNFARAIRKEERPHISPEESIRNARVLDMIHNHA